jgi:hypothetical protein
MKFFIFSIFFIVGLSCKNEFQEKQPKQRKAIKTKTVDLPPWRKYSKEEIINKEY